MNDKILINDHEKTLLISSNDLLYLTTTENAHQIKAVTYKETFLLKGSLSALETKYSNLIRCHRQILVNMHTIQGIDRKKKVVLFFNDNRTCPISRRTYKELYDTWSNYLNDNFNTVQD